MKLLPVALLVLICSYAAYAQTKAVDYLSVKSPVVFQKKTYNLAWSSHPTANYYKHEYLQKGESLDRFKTMILLEVLSGPTKLSDVVGAKLAELQSMQKANPLIQYEVFNNKQTGEYLLSFVLTATGADGKPTIAESNVYRYKTLKAPNGKEGILLFGFSTRSYGREIDSFLKSAKANAKVLINEITQLSPPQVSF